METKQRIRMVAVDLDGTLMDRNNHIARTAMDEIRRLNEHGCMVVPCTGRFLRAIPRDLMQMGKIRYAITANGAQIWDARALRSMYRVKLPEGAVAEVLEFMRGRDGYVELFSQGKSYVNEGDALRAGKNVRDDNFVRYFRQDHVMVPSLYEAVPVWEEAEKLNVFFMNPCDREMLTARLKSRGDLQITSSMAGNVEINAAAANKGKAMGWLCRQMGIEWEATLAIGDGDNDMEMIEFAGYGIAMGNSPDQLKRRACYVTGDHDSGGAEEILKRIGRRDRDL